MAYQDLLKDASTLSADNNYVIVTITDLTPNSSYPIQFRWKYNDSTFGPWSASKLLTTPSETVPDTPDLGVEDVIGGPGFIKVTWSGNGANGSPISNIDRVEIHVAGGTFGIDKVVDSFKVGGTKTIVAEAGTYIVQLKGITVAGTTSFFSQARTVEVSAIGVPVEPPTNPNGFTIDRILGGIKLNWAGTYANGTFSGFEAIKIYVGTSATATPGTYIEAGSLTGNNVKNAIVIPVDGTYLKYSTPVYIHAAAINTNGVVGTLQQNVASNLLGAKGAIADDLENNIISELKLIDGAITEAKISDNAITAGKISANAITSDKIAANSITAGKIQALSIDVSKLAAGTISVNNLEAGTISSTSYIRAGVAGAARVEMSSASISGGPSAGFYIYNSAGNAVLSAPLSGGLSIVGNGTFTGDITGASGQFDGDLGASGGTFKVRSGIVTALAGNIGGLVLSADSLQNSSSTFKIDSSGKISAGTLSGAHITIDPLTGIQHSNGNFVLDINGNVTVKGVVRAESGWLGNSDGNNYWGIGSGYLTAFGSAKINLGNYYIGTNGTSQFNIWDTDTNTSVLRTDSVSNATDPKRIYLGDYTRQVEVAKSAQISGNGTIFGATYDSTAINAYRSGGLRNMFTISDGNYSALGNSVFPDAINGDILIVYSA